MTQEEKAKAYDEALDRMKHVVIVPKDEKALQALKETIFPELHESEDERIRKELIEFIQWVEDRGMTRHDYHQAKRPAEWIAYLEKQKEKSWMPTEGEMGVLYKLCYLSNQISDDDDTELTRLYQDLKREYFNGHSFENMFPKQKEQDKCPEYCVRSHCIGCPIYEKQKEQKPNFSEKDSTDFEIEVHEIIAQASKEAHS